MSRVECADANNASAVEMESTLEDDKDKKLPELYWMVNLFLNTIVHCILFVAVKMLPLLITKV
jgi:hypothetical protein